MRPWGGNRWAERLERNPDLFRRTCLAARTYLPEPERPWPLTDWRRSVPPPPTRRLVR